MTLVIFKLIPYTQVHNMILLKYLLNFFSSYFCSFTNVSWKMNFMFAFIQSMNEIFGYENMINKNFFMFN